jgi:hypothetical protein
MELLGCLWLHRSLLEMANDGCKGARVLKEELGRAEIGFIGRLVGEQILKFRGCRVLSD